jgi:hypothetical protein
MSKSDISIDDVTKIWQTFPRNVRFARLGGLGHRHKPFAQFLDSGLLVVWNPGRACVTREWFAWISGTLIGINLPDKLEAACLDTAGR